MTIKVTIKAEATPAERAVYRIEQHDESGRATNISPWFALPQGGEIEHYVHSCVRVVVEQYDEARHGKVKET